MAKKSSRVERFYTVTWEGLECQLVGEIENNNGHREFLVAVPVPKEPEEVFAEKLKSLGWRGSRCVNIILHEGEFEHAENYVDRQGGQETI